MIALIASLVIATNAAPAEALACCRSMLPDDVVIEGRVILRNRRGIVQLERPYVLRREKGVTTVDIDDETLAGTDVKKGDLALEYLWWDDCSYDAGGDSDTVHGQSCAVLRLKKDRREMKVWVDRRTGALMQAEELEGDKSVRRLWGTRIKKFDTRWMANVMEVETLGSGHRTKITVEKLLVEDARK